MMTTIIVITIIVVVVIIIIIIITMMRQDKTAIRLLNHSRFNTSSTCCHSNRVPSPSVIFTDASWSSWKMLTRFVLHTFRQRKPSDSL